MLLSHRYQFLFVHIAKTGGTSVRRAMRRYKWRDYRRLPLWLASRVSRLHQHELMMKPPRHAKAIAAREMLPSDYYEQLYKFAFVRNPWDLQVSAWHHLQREHPHLLDGLGDFPAFLRHKLDARRKPNFLFDISSEPQWHYCIDLQGQCILDFIGRYESFPEDFGCACQDIGIGAPELPHRRRAKQRGDYREYYTDADAELVAQHFAPDLTAFGYRFDDAAAA